MRVGLFAIFFWDGISLRFGVRRRRCTLHLNYFDDRDAQDLCRRVATAISFRRVLRDSGEPGEAAVGTPKMCERCDAYGESTGVLELARLTRRVPDGCC